MALGDTQTYFEVVVGHWGGGLPEVYAHASREGALARAAALRDNYRPVPGHPWSPSKPAVNEDGYEQCGWEVKNDIYIYVGERVLHD